MRDRTFVRVLLVIGTFAPLARAVPGASFTGTGFLEPDSQSIAYAVSADGRVVVGETIAPLGFEAFRWTVEDGMVGLGFLALDTPSSQAFGVSADGSIITGASTIAGAFSEDGAPFRWTATDGMQQLPNLGGADTGGRASAITLDGGTIVGQSASSDAIYQPVYWKSGAAHGLGLLANEQLGNAAGISADGSIIVGNISSGTIAFPRAFRWTADSGPVLLSTLNPGALSSANAITPDGRSIVGQSGGRAAIWDASLNVSSLGEFAGGLPASLYWATGITAGGTTVVGIGEYNATQGTGEAFIWDAGHGIRRLREVLTGQYGINLNGWALFEATSISADGTVIVGYGFDPQGYQEGWVVHLPPLRGDVNCDGTINFADIDYFVAALPDNEAAWSALFASQHAGLQPFCPFANNDIDGDGHLGFADIDPFVALLSGS